jgi:hypothetical protein
MQRLAQAAASAQPAEEDASVVGPDRKMLAGVATGQFSWRKGGTAIGDTREGVGAVPVVECRGLCSAVLLAE